MQAIEQSNSATMTKDSNRGSVSSMPGGFAGNYQAGYEAGYASGQAGLRRGHAKANQNPNDNARVALVDVNTPAERKPLLLGMPCAKCRVYLYSEETRCPVCRSPRQPQELKSA